MYWATPGGGYLRELVTTRPTSAARHVKDLVAADIRECYRIQGWHATIEDVSQEPSTLRSVLVPMSDGGFTAVINAQRRPSAAEVDWLLAHEYAHTFFYSQGSPPQRTVRHSDVEERACDQFADAFIELRAPVSAA